MKVDDGVAQTQRLKRRHLFCRSKIFLDERDKLLKTEAEVVLISAWKRQKEQTYLALW